MTDSLPIDEVVRRTGLTSRALRFYEARGLVRPLRTGSGRRLYSPAQLERLGQLMALKRAGFTLAAIGQVFSGRGIATPALLRVQLDAIEQQQSELADAAALLRTALSRVEGGEPLDAATLCSLIRNGDRIMTQKQQWDAASAPYLSDQAKADFAAMPCPEGFDQEAYAAQWAALGAKIKAALPLDPAGEEAQALRREWQALLAPFAAMATPAMMEGVSKMYDNMPKWGEHTGGQAPSPGFDAEVWQFIQAVGRANPA
jgi:MerR family transcriptional regulator, thiopeptide resistance regulator